MASTGSYSLPLENLRILVANSSTFQTWVGAIDATAALARIYKIAKAEAGLVRPFCMVDHESTSKTKIAEPNTFEPSGALRLFFEDVPDDSDASNEAIIEAFTNEVGGIIDDMEALAGTDGFLMATGFNESSPPTRYQRSKSQSEGDIIQCSWFVDWGV